MSIEDILGRNRIVPLVTVTDAAAAVPLARALKEGGIGIIEIALRTHAACEAIAEVRHALPDMIVGAGTVKCDDDFQRAASAGAQFAVSPGITQELIESASKWDIPFLPGVSTTSESMMLASAGMTVQKFFPAGAMGGIDALNALAGPLPEVRFCAAGGITEQNAASYLRLANVIAVSGSWLVPATDADIETLTQHTTQNTTQNARRALDLTDLTRG